MNILGISTGFHDAGVSVINQDGCILFAAHSERYSKQKHDKYLNQSIIDTAFSYGEVDRIAYYEIPWRKKTREIYAGQGFGDGSCLSAQKTLAKQGFVFAQPVSEWPHHMTHAAAGFQTSPFDHATCVVIDAIGEWDTITIWDAKYDNNGVACYKKLYSRKYPHRLGLLYSAITDYIGLRPMDEEYITMGMAGWGEPRWADILREQYICDSKDFTLKQNVHAGVGLHYLDPSPEDMAASIQLIAEQEIHKVMSTAQHKGRSANLVYMGGVALNCVANSKIASLWNDVWIMPNPGDCGSSLGAAALEYGKKLQWTTPYLGTNISGPYPVGNLVKELKRNQIAGVANGRAEFGPRALGNRSLLADPRGPAIKDKVNEIKRRQKFRPFAPVILEEHASEYFDMPVEKSPYMQFVARVKDPESFPAITHVDGTARVQTVGKSTHGSGIRQLLEVWYRETGCPMLLNTSLNIRGEPMVDTTDDAKRWTEQYGVPVYTTEL